MEAPKERSDTGFLASQDNKNTSQSQISKDYISPYFPAGHDDRVQTLPHIPAEDLTSKQCLGRGAYGEVQYAKWHGADVAVKTMWERNDPLSAETSTLFQFEANQMYLLRHPHTVMLYGVCISPSAKGQNQYSIVMEYLSGGTLHDVLKGYRFDPSGLAWSTRIQIASDVAAGLVYLHGKDMVHGDLTSVNILLDSQSRAKLSDFGLLRTKHEINPEPTKFKVQWAAPEVIQVGDVKSPSDMYSYGVLLHEIATCVPPFDSTTSWEETKNRVLSGDRDVIPPDIKDKRPGYVKLIQDCWDLSPGYRPKAIDAIEVLITEKMRYHNTTFDLSSLSSSSDLEDSTNSLDGAVHNPSNIAYADIDIDLLEQVQDKRYVAVDLPEDSSDDSVHATRDREFPAINLRAKTPENVGDESIQHALIHYRRSQRGGSENANTVDDSNGAYNALALGLSRFLINDQLSGASCLPLYQQLMASYGEEIKTTEGNQIQQWLNTLSREETQKKLAPQLRELSIHIIESHYGAYYQRYYEECLWASYQDWCQTGQRDEMFLVHAHIDDYFKAQGNTLSRDSLTHWWRSGGKDRYFNNIRATVKDTTDTTNRIDSQKWGSKIEIDALAIALGFNILWCQQGTKEPLGICGGLVPLEGLNEDEVSLLIARGVGWRYLNTFRIRALPSLSVLMRQLKALDKETETIVWEALRRNTLQFDVDQLSSIHARVDKTELIERLTERNIITKRGDKFYFEANDKGDIHFSAIVDRMKAVDTKTRQLLLSHFLV